MKNEEGITLVELIVVISIIGILVVALGFSFQGWMGSYNVESQMRSMYIDLMNARTRAMQRNRVHFVNLSATQYTIYEDTYNATDATNPDGDGILQTGSDFTFLLKSLNPRYPITWSNSGDPVPQIQFNKKGLANDTRYICCNSAANADYNCIGIDTVEDQYREINNKDSGWGGVQCQRIVFQNRDGFTLVEMMIALVIALVIFLALMQTALVGIDSNLRNVLRDEAVSIADMRMNETRNMPFNSVVSDAGSLSGDCPVGFPGSTGVLVERNIRNITGF